MKIKNSNLLKLSASYNKIYGVKHLTNNLLQKKYGVNSKLPLEFINRKVYNNVDFILNKYANSTKLNQEQRNNIKFLKNIKNYKGFRHKNSLPVRGQRTRTNAKTVKKRYK
jgi:small subunit ribosomal protein S13